MLMKVLLFFILIFVTLSDVYYVNARESAEESTFLEPFFFEYETYDNEEPKEISKEWGDFHYAERKYEPYKYTYDKKTKIYLYLT